ncbi:MAG: LL-diaminopimelate aminotransferase [Clostridia bacterium]|nr:LL-diaminopimelate aminotransferase [Clostridia bacterium]
MFEVNSNYGELQGSYLFSEIASRVAAYEQAHPDADIIRLGIGDVTEPLMPAVIEAIKKATDEMASRDTFRGYGPEQGYAFLRDAIAEHDYKALGADISADDIFVSDGAKCDTGNIQELLSPSSRVAVTDPVYPVYVDTNVMAGRAGSYNKEAGQYKQIVYLPCTAENGFDPALPKEKVDVVYLCSPNNPTGTALNQLQLQKWVDWARDTGALILFDAAYERFITQPDIPHTIYQCSGAETCAIEFRSFSKTAGFTGTRCAYTVVPKTVFGQDASGTKVSMHDLWLRRQTTKFNGVSYIVQCGAAAVYTPQGEAEVTEVIDRYLKNARIILDGLAKIGIKAYGGVNSPYVWLQTPNGMPSWDFFDLLLNQAQVVGTPGAGFGSAGEGYFRLTAFNTRENTERAVARLGNLSLT